MAAFLPNEPYRGISSFRYNDRAIYAGRESEIEKLYRMILQFRGLLIFGNSGVGKSSMIAAGFIPYLFDNPINVDDKPYAFAPELIRLNMDTSGTFVISRIKNSESENTFEPSFFDEFAIGDSPKINVSIENFEAKFSTPTDHNADEDIRTHVLIFDQFEELITLFEDSSAASHEEYRDRISLQSQIIKLITTLHFNKNLRLKLVFAFREDYLARFGKLFNLVPDLKDHYLRVKAIPTTEVEKILTKPFDTEEKRARYPHYFSEKFIKTLAEKITRRYPDGQLNLTELQIIAYQLYLKKSTGVVESVLTAEEPESLLENYYLGLISKVQKEHQRVAIDILAILVMNESTRNVVHIDAIRDACSKRYTKEEIDRAITILENEVRIIRKENRQGGFYYEIVSEAIIPFINRKKVEKEQEQINAQKGKRVGVALAIVLPILAAIVSYTTYYNTTLGTYESWLADKKILNEITLREYGTYPAYREALEFQKVLDSVQFISFNWGDARILMDSVQTRVTKAFRQEPFYEYTQANGIFSPDGRYFMNRVGGEDTFRIYDRLHGRTLLKTAPAGFSGKANGTLLGRSSPDIVMKQDLCMVTYRDAMALYKYDENPSPFFESEPGRPIKSPVLSEGNDLILSVESSRSTGYGPHEISSTYHLISINDKVTIPILLYEHGQFVNAVKTPSSFVVYTEKTTYLSSPFEFPYHVEQELVKTVYPANAQPSTSTLIASSVIKNYVPMEEELTARRFTFYNVKGSEHWVCYDLSQNVTPNDSIPLPRQVTQPVDILMSSSDTLVVDKTGLIMQKERTSWNVIDALKKLIESKNTADSLFGPSEIVKASFLGDSTEIYVFAPPFVIHYDLKTQTLHSFDQNIYPEKTLVFKPTSKSIAVIQEYGISFVWYLRTAEEQSQPKRWAPEALQYPLKPLVNTSTARQSNPINTK
jgi:hypothetical protein